MNKVYDESDVIRLVRKYCKMNTAKRAIYVSKSAIIGLTTWSRIDCLVNHFGWHVEWNNESINEQNDDDIKRRKRDAK